MGNEWLSCGGSGGGGNSRREKMKEAATASAGCMSALLNLFHFHHFRFASAHRNHSNSYPFLQEEAITPTGLEAPRNSLELAMKQEENLNFPVGIRIRTSHGRISRLDDIYSQSNSPGTKTPSVVARLMGLDLLPESNPLRLSVSDNPSSAAVRSLPETPRKSSASRKSDVEPHRLSLQTNKADYIFKDEFSLSGQKAVCRRGRFKKDGGSDRRSFGLDITNTNRNSDRSKTDQNLSLHNPNKKNSKISSKNGKEGSPRSRISDKKLPPRAAAVDRDSKSRREKVVLSGERKKSDRTLLRVKNGPSPLHTKLPRKKVSSESDALSSKTNTQLSNKPSQPYSTNGSVAAALHGGASRNYGERILKHAVDGYDAVTSHRSERKLIFQLVDELLGRVLTSPLQLNRWVSPVGCFPVVEELCKRTGSFPAAKCVVLEDIDSLIERDLRESQSSGYWVEEEGVVCEIEGEIVEWLVHEAVAVMGGAAAEEQTEIGVCRVGR